MEKFTTKTLMERVGMSYEGAYSLLKRMKENGYVRELSKASNGTKTYGLFIPPEIYLTQEQQKRRSPPPPSGFYNNPFNL